MSDEATIILGNHRVDATGSVILVSRGQGVFIRAAGDESDLLLEAENAAKIICGPAVIALSGPDPAQGNIGLYGGEAGSITSLVGLPDLGAQIKVGPEMITLSVGPPGAGASITMTPESITFKVAEVSFTMTPEGITEDVAEVTREATPEGHTLTAAETVFNVGVAGIQKEAPTEEGEIEGGAENNMSILNQSVDAMNSQEAGITMIE